jgi:hypothetical protein
MMHSVYVCALFFVPTDIQKSNNVKLVQSRVPAPPRPSDPTKLTLVLRPTALDVVTVVVCTAFAVPVSCSPPPRFAVGALYEL